MNFAQPIISSTFYEIIKINLQKMDSITYTDFIFSHPTNGIGRIPVDPSLWETDYFTSWSIKIHKAFLDCLDIKYSTASPTNWSGGFNFNFKSNYQLYDSPLPSTWAETIQKISFGIFILEARPASMIPSNDSLNQYDPGLVVFVIQKFIEIVKNTTNPTKIIKSKPIEMTQLDFVRMLIDGKSKDITDKIIIPAEISQDLLNVYKTGGFK